MTDTVDEYVNGFEGEKREWLDTMVAYMRENFPQANEVISYQMPMWKFSKTMYIGFSIAKEHFTFHTLDFAAIEELKGLLPKATFGRGSAKIPFDRRESIPILFNMIRKIVARNGVTAGNS
jgi:uncharacterized protein YdhG (YjbR/CyaY superfamily)